MTPGSGSPSPAAPDRALLARAQRGDEDALEQMIRQYQERIARKVLSVVGADGDWQDLCQRIFVKMVLGLPRLKNPALLEPWLMRIARNECFDHLRRRRARRIFVPWERAHDDIAGPPGEPSKIEYRLAAFDDAVDQLPQDQRELINLVRTREYSYEALAARTGNTVAAIKSRLFRARRKLRDLLDASDSVRQESCDAVSIKLEGQASE
jgi:RNA polymerase sigma factor (sigma-70 family)